MSTLRQQIRNNSVALISLAVALTGLAYNTWRNERTEHNRNVRAAGFEIVLALGELQQVVFFAHYVEGDDRGDPRAGWAQVLTIQDLSKLVPAGTTEAANELHGAWSQNWSGLGSDTDALQAIDVAIDEMRASTLASLKSLD